MNRPPTTSDAPSQQQFRRFISRADALTLLGMVTLIFSLFLVWQKTSIPIPMGADVAYLAPSVQLSQSGYSLPDWMLMVGCAVAANVCLLITATPRNRYALSLLQGIFGVGGFLLILRHLSPQIGSVVGTGAGALLAWGALERFREDKTLSSQDSGK